MKRCSLCGEDKPYGEFTRLKVGRDGYHPRCRKCRSRLAHEWNLANPERAREHQRNWIKRHPEDKVRRDRETHLKRYGLTPETFEELLASQGGVCAGCKRPEPVGNKGWVIDHDHGCCNWLASSGPLCGSCVRGVLCAPCNSALGMVRESKETLVSLIEYLDRHAVRR